MLCLKTKPNQTKISPEGFDLNKSFKTSKKYICNYMRILFKIMLHIKITYFIYIKYIFCI